VVRRDLLSLAARNFSAGGHIRCGEYREAGALKRSQRWQSWLPGPYQDTAIFQPINEIASLRAIKLTASRSCSAACAFPQCWTLLRAVHVNSSLPNHNLVRISSGYSALDGIGITVAALANRTVLEFAAPAPWSCCCRLPPWCPATTTAPSLPENDVWAGAIPWVNGSSLWEDGDREGDTRVELAPIVMVTSVEGSARIFLFQLAKRRNFIMQREGFGNDRKMRSTDYTFHRKQNRDVATC